MRKKLLSMLLTLCMVLTLLPTVALAIGDPAPTTSVHVGGVTLTYTDTPVYATTNSSGAVTTGGATADNYNIKFENTTLTLRNANIKYVDTSNPAIWVSGTLTVMAFGVNTVTKSVVNGNAIQANFLTLQGTGTLTATSEKGGAVWGINNLTIKGSITLNAVSGVSSSQCGYQGLRSDETIVIEENAVVTAVGGKSYSPAVGFGSAGICATNSVTIQGNANVTAVGGDATTGGRSVGINAGIGNTATITIGGSAQVVAVGGKSTSESYGLFASDGDGDGTGTITYTGGLLVARSDSAPTSKAMNKAMINSGGTVAPLTGEFDSTFAVWGPADTYTVLNSALDLTYNETTSDWSDSANARGWKWNYSAPCTLTLKNIIINAPDANDPYCYGINLSGSNVDLKLEGVNIVNAGNPYSTQQSYGILSPGGNVAISGETLITLGGSAGSMSYGISSNGSLSLNANTIIAIGGAASSHSAGLITTASAGDVNIKGGSVTAIGGSAGSSSNGISSARDTNITGGSVIAVGGSEGNHERDGIGIYSYRSIKITGGIGVAVAGSKATAKAFWSTPQGDADHALVLTNGSWSGKMAAWSVKTPQTIAFANPGAQNFGTTPTLTAAASSGLPVTFTSSTPDVATITSGGVLTFVSAGTATIHANQAGNDTFAAATEVTWSFEVIAAAPGAPTAVTATAGDGQASVSFTAPASNGGSPITVYTVTVSPADVPPVNGASSPIVVTGLTNGTTYTFTVTANNVAGAGAASAASNSITPQIQETTPEATIDYVNETLTSLTSGAAYAVNSADVTADGDGKIAIQNAWLGNTISLVKKGNGTSTVDSAAQSITLAARPSTPSCTALQPSASSATGTVSGITTAMQYSTNGGTSWIDGTGTDVTDLNPGMVLIRVKAVANTAPAGLNQSITITAYSAPPSGGGGTTTPPAPVTEIENGGSTTGSNLEQLVSASKPLTVSDDNGAKLVFEPDALKGIAGQAAGEIKVEMTDVSPAHQENLPGKLVFSLTVSSGGSSITNFGGAVTVTLPYTLKEGETADAVTVWYLASDGTMTEIPCTYDSVTGVATFKVTHFSLYVVGVDTPWVNPFTDVSENDWFYGAVAFASRNNLMQGDGGTDFSPNTTVTRGMLVTILWRLENEPAAAKTISFADVADGTWYAKAVTWASANNIVNGYEGRFNPDGALTREQLAALLYRYAAYKNYDVSASDSLSAFADKPSGWAQQGVSWAVAEGLIQGSEGRLNPTGSATRAQAATILQRFMENTTK